MRTLISVVLVALTAVACSDDDLPKYSKLDSFRVLALKMDPPEVNPGSSVTITPWVSDPFGNGRNYTVTVQSCNDPGVSIGKEGTCETSSSKRDEYSTASETITGTVGTGTTTPIVVTVPASALTGRSAAEQLVGVPYLVTFTIRANDNGEEQRTYTTILVSTKPSNLNANPDITAILGNGGSFSSVGVDPIVLTPSFSAQSREVYSGITEELTTTWFSNGGSIQRTRTINDAENKYTPQAERPAEGLVLIAITRDGRGGLDVERKNL